MITENGFLSAYDIDKLQYTTVKFRKELEVKIEDYIFYKTFGNESLKVNVKSTLEIPNLSDDEMKVGCPKANYPSDHFMIGA